MESVFILKSQIIGAFRQSPTFTLFPEVTRRQGSRSSFGKWSGFDERVHACHQGFPANRSSIVLSSQFTFKMEIPTLWNVNVQQKPDVSVLVICTGQSKLRLFCHWKQLLIKVVFFKVYKLIEFLTDEFYPFYFSFEFFCKPHTICEFTAHAQILSTTNFLLLISLVCEHSRCFMFSAVRRLLPDFDELCARTYVCARACVILVALKCFLQEASHCLLCWNIPSCNPTPKQEHTRAQTHTRKRRALPFSHPSPLLPVLSGAHQRLLDGGLKSCVLQV